MTDEADKLLMYQGHQLAVAIVTATQSPDDDLSLDGLCREAGFDVMLVAMGVLAALVNRAMDPDKIRDFARMVEKYLGPT